MCIMADICVFGVYVVMLMMMMMQCSDMIARVWACPYDV